MERGGETAAAAQETISSNAKRARGNFLSSDMLTVFDISSFSPLLLHFKLINTPKMLCRIDCHGSGWLRLMPVIISCVCALYFPLFRSHFYFLGILVFLFLILMLMRTRSYLCLFFFLLFLYFSLSFSPFLFPYFDITHLVTVGVVIATQSEPVHQPISSLADTAYPKQNQYFDSTNMAYVLELSNSKTNQNNGDDEEDDGDDDIRSSSDSDSIRANNQKYVNVSSRDSRNFYNNNNRNIGDDADKMNNVLNRGPFFDVSASKNVTALVGKTANLNCRIKNLANKTVK